MITSEMLRTAVLVLSAILGGLAIVLADYIVTGTSIRESLRHGAWIRLPLAILGGIQAAAFPGASALLAAHNGVFFALCADEFRNSRGKSERSKINAAPVATAGVLLLEGFWQVYGVGCFGAFLAELYAVYESRAKVHQWPWHYWLLSVVMIVVGGGLVVLYGITSVNALLAAQLGATAPLVVKRWRR